MSLDAKIAAFRPSPIDFAVCSMHEYGATAAELEQFEKRTHDQIEKGRKAGKLHEFTGNIEDCVTGKGH